VEELEEDAAEENGISDRHNPPTFIPPLTSLLRVGSLAGGFELHNATSRADEVDDADQLGAAEVSFH
jgi:hypothetical protein